jgi:hypothetical protein
MNNLQSQQRGPKAHRAEPAAIVFAPSGSVEGRGCESEAQVRLGQTLTIRRADVGCLYLLTQLHHQEFHATDRLGCGKKSQSDLAHTNFATLSRM